MVIDGIKLIFYSSLQIDCLTSGSSHAKGDGALAIIGGTHPVVKSNASSSSTSLLLAESWTA